MGQAPSYVNSCGREPLRFSLHHLRQTVRSRWCHRPPTWFVISLAHAPVVRRPWPLLGPRYQPVMHRIEMDVIEMTIEIVLAANLVFPESALPHGGFTFALARCVARAFSPTAREVRAGKGALQIPPTRRIVVVAVWECPNAVQVFGQKADRVECNGIRFPHFKERITKAGSGEVRGENWPAIERDNGEKERCSFLAQSPVIGHLGKSPRSRPGCLNRRMGLAPC